MTDRKISELTALTSVTDTDKFAIVDDSATETKHVVRDDIFGQGLSTTDSPTFAGGTYTGTINIVPVSGTASMNIKASASNAFFRLENTSTTVKWQCTNTSGASDQFRIENYDGAAWTIPVKIINSAPTDSLVIDASGQVLIGTSTSGASVLRVSGLPTSSAGLSAGDVWNNSGVLTIV